MLKNKPEYQRLRQKEGEMALTRQQREAQEADEFLDGLSTPQPEATPAESAQPEATPPEPEATPAAPQDNGEIQSLREELARLQAIITDENNPTYRHRYEVLAGKYNAEIPRLTEKIKELEAKISAVPQKPQKPQRQPEYETAFNDLVDEHGPATAKNLITIAHAIAQEIVEQQLPEKLRPVDEQVRQVDEQVKQLAQGQQRADEGLFFNTLSSIVPDWKQINGWGPDGIPQDPKFTRFLTQAVPGTDFTYNDLLLTHYQNGKAGKVKEIFDLYKAGNTAPAHVPAAPAKGVEQFIDPGKTGKGTPTPTDNQKKTYTQAEVDGYFDSRVKGTFKGTRDEAARLEAEYTAAILDGRVR